MAAPSNRPSASHSHDLAHVDATIIDLHSEFRASAIANRHLHRVFADADRTAL
jgi:hypothetical protein